MLKTTLIPIISKFMPFVFIGVSVISFSTGYYLADLKGDKIALGLKTDIAELTRAHALEVNKIRTENQNTILTLNKKLKEQKTELEAEYDKENKAIKERADVIINDLRDGNVRLRDRYAKESTTCPVVETRPEASSNTASPAGSSETEPAGAVISRETSEFLITLAKEADLTVSALKQCVGQYESIRTEFNNTEIIDETEITSE